MTNDNQNKECSSYFSFFQEESHLKGYFLQIQLTHVSNLKLSFETKSFSLFSTFIDQYHN